MAREIEKETSFIFANWKAVVVQRESYDIRIASIALA